MLNKALFFSIKIALIKTKLLVFQITVANSFQIVYNRVNRCVQIRKMRGSL